MYKTIFLFGMITGCESTDKEKQSETEFEEESIVCPTGMYPALLQVWSESVAEDEGNLVDVPPICEALFDIELLDEGGIYSIGECEFQGGQQTRVLAYEFQGSMEGDGIYIGEVGFTKRNGEVEFAQFIATCEQQEENVAINLDWSMTVTTPHGEVEHTGILATQ